MDDIHELGEEILALDTVVEEKNGSCAIKEKVQNIKSIMSRLLNYDIMSLLQDRAQSASGKTQSKIVKTCAKNARDKLKKKQVQ